jgi:cephalosporin hydroxylase
MSACWSWPCCKQARVQLHPNPASSEGRSIIQLSGDSNEHRDTEQVQHARRLQTARVLATADSSHQVEKSK